MSPVLVNLFLHYALDRWLATNHPSVHFCRYADDGIVHCRSEAEAKAMREHLDARLGEVGLELHPEKTLVVYCKDRDRTGTAENIAFDFLGYTFRPRVARSRSGRLFTTCSPAMSRESACAIRQTVRRWRLHLKSETSLATLARRMSPIVRGWIGYYCRFRASSFQSIARHLDRVLVRWAMRKYKRLRARPGRAFAWLESVKAKRPELFVHWTGRGAFAVGAMGAR